MTPRQLLGAAALAIGLGFACAAEESSEGSPDAQSWGTIEFGLVLEEGAPPDAPRDDYAHWSAGGTWTVPDERIWSLERPLLTCRVQSTERDVDRYGFPALQVTLVPFDADVFLEYTRSAIGRRLAVLVEEQVILAPTLTGPMNGTFVIQGRFSEENVELLQTLLEPAAPR